jgi:hypothetical protein
MKRIVGKPGQNQTQDSQAHEAKQHVFLFGSKGKLIHHYILLGKQIYWLRTIAADLN